MTLRDLIVVVDDNCDVRDSLRALLEISNYRVMDFASAEAFLDAKVPDGKCLISDIRMAGMDGLALQAELTRRKVALPIIFITGHGDVSLAVRGLRAGAVDFLEKPFDADIILSCVARAVTVGAHSGIAEASELQAQAQLALLSPREHQVFDQMVTGHSTKAIAQAIGLSPRTVEVHRGNIMRKLKVKSLADLTRIDCAAAKHAEPMILPLDGKAA